MSETEREISSLKEVIKGYERDLAVCHRQYQAEEDESTRLHEQYDSLRALVDTLIDAGNVLLHATDRQLIAVSDIKEWKDAIKCIQVDT